MATDRRKQPLLVLLGPTACGKTGLSLEIASYFDAEIISGDSMQIYRGMDIGTAKIKPSETRNIPHHMLDIVSPLEPFSVADFRDKTNELIDLISSRGHLPFIVGGTGLYISSLLYPYDFGTEADPDPAIREELKQKYATLGGEKLHEELASVDPVSAAKIHPNDEHRIIRALEVYQLTGQPISKSHKIEHMESPFFPLIIGLKMDRQLLYKRIGQRVDQMINEGLIEEVRQLMDQGLTKNHQSMQGIGYRQMISYLEGEISLEEAIELIKRDTRRYAKRQMTWFNRMENIKWFDVDHYGDKSALCTEICEWIADQLKE